MKETGLPVVLRLAGRNAIVLGDGPAAEAKRRLLQRAGALLVDEAADAAVAVVAIEDEAHASAAVERLRARGIPVNAVDRIELCDFTLPAIVERGPVLVAVATGGASAGLAAALRQRIEALLPASLGELARALAAHKAALRSRWPDAAERRRALGAALAAGGPLDPLVDHDRRAVSRWLSEGTVAADRLVTIRLRSPDPDELTLREARLLGQADRLYHRADVPTAILDRARADAARIPCDAAPAEPGPGLSLDLALLP